MTESLISAEACRAARGLLAWTQGDLADQAGISRQTIIDFEKGARSPHPNNLAALRRALEDAGVTFLPAGPYQGDGGPGVRLRSSEG